MLEGQLEENGNELPPIEDITTIPEEASEELREEEAAAMEAALRTPDEHIINTEVGKFALAHTPTTSTTTTMTMTTTSTTMGARE